MTSPRTLPKIEPLISEDPLWLQRLRMALIVIGGIIPVAALVYVMVRL